MVDKVVGDAVHAFFNAPEDLADHVDKAIDCAKAIHALTEEMRQAAAASPQRDFGRTRIGIETGIRPCSAKSAPAASSTTPPMATPSILRRGFRRQTSFSGTAICVGPAAAAESEQQLRSLGMP